MARKRQVILMRSPDGSDAGKSGAMVPLGSLTDVVRALSAYNISPDGSGPEGLGDVAGFGRLYGPGFIAEVPTGLDDVNQVMVSITDEDFAWSVLMRLCRQLRWKMMDPESGRTFG